MGSACSKGDQEMSQSREVITQTYGRTKKSKGRTEKQKEQSISWFEKCSICVESWGTPTKRILPKKTSFISNYKYVVICRITVERKQLAQGTLVNKKQSKLNCALRLPELDWGSVPVELQFPKLLPLNLWPGETYIFGFLSSDSHTTSKVTLAGKVGNEDVCISQQVIHNPSFSTERWKRIGDLLTAEMSKHKMTLTKGMSKNEVRKRASRDTYTSRDTGYTSTSYKYSSDASHRAQPQRMDKSSDSDEDTGATSEKRWTRRQDSALSPMHCSVQMSYKRRVEESKLVEERESSTKSTDDSKSPSSAEKEFAIRKQSQSSRNKKHSKQARTDQAASQDERKRFRDDVRKLISDRCDSSEKTESSDSQKNNYKAKKKKSASSKKSKDVSETESDKPKDHQKTSEVKNEITPDEEDKTFWINDEDADDESDEIYESALFSDTVLLEKGDIISAREHAVRPQTLKLPSVEEDADKNYSDTDDDILNETLSPTTDKNKLLAIKRHSLSEIMEKQGKQDPNVSPQQRYHGMAAAMKEMTEHNAQMTMSPKAKYFALHQYGSEEKKSVGSDAVDSPLDHADPINKYSQRASRDKARENGEASSVSLEHSPAGTGCTAAARESESVEGQRIFNIDSSIDENKKVVLERGMKTPLENKETEPDVGEHKILYVDESKEEIAIEGTVADTSVINTVTEPKVGEGMDVEKLNDTDDCKENETDLTNNLCSVGKYDVLNEESPHLNPGPNTENSNINSKTLLMGNWKSIYDSKDTNAKRMKDKSQGDDISHIIKKDRKDISLERNTPLRMKITTETEPKHVETDYEARIRVQSFGGSKSRSASSSKFKRYESEERTDLQSIQASRKEMPSPVYEIAPAPNVKEAFVSETDEEQHDPGKLRETRSPSARRSTKQPLEHQTRMKISKFYRQSSKGIKK